MIIEVIPAGEGYGPPVRLAANQVVVRQNNGTIIFVAGEYGEAGTQAVARVGDPDFDRTLRLLGIRETVVCDRIILPAPPPGARLVAGPR